MDGFLRQSTAVDLPIGPFLDSTDGITAETALTISQADVRLKKNNGAWAQINDNTSATHEENGWYEKEFDATDTNTVGILKVAVHESGALPVFHTFQILEEAVYDALFAASALGYVANAPVNVAQWLGSAAATPTVAGVPEVDVTHWIGTAAATPTTAGVPEVDITHIAGSAVSTTTAQLGVNVVQISGDSTSADNLESYTDGTTPQPVNTTQWGGTAVASATVNANMTQISGDSTAADNLETSYDDTAGPVARDGIVDQGTAQSATSTTLVLRSAAAFADDELIGATILITGGSAGVGQARLITDYVSSSDTATVEAWTTTPSGTITYKIFATAPSSGGAGLDAAGVRAAVGLASANLDTQLSGIQSDTDNIQTRLPTSLVSGRIDASVGAMAANVITAAATAADFTTEVTSGLATQASVDTIDNFLDTEIAAIQSDVAAILLDTGTDGVVVASGSKTGYALSAAGVDAIWDEAQSGHVTAGTFGVYLDSAVSGVSTGGVSAAEIADAVWDEDATGHQTQGTFGQAIGDPAADTDSIWALVNTNLNATVSSRASQTSVDTVDDFLDTEIAALTTNLATANTNINTIDDFLDTEVAAILAAVDTEVAAIKAKTDSLTFTQAGHVDANIQRINDVTITGNGQSGTEFSV